MERLSLERVAREARACRLCEAVLPHAPRPVFHIGRGARLMIVGQAPGRRVHETGIPWNDPSGDRLRAWLAMDRETFYDRAQIAILPTGLCYPGTVDGSDLPPRPECAPLWHPRFRAALPNIRLTLLVGQYAQAHYLGAARKSSLSETVRAYREYLPNFFPLPHPSWRNSAWITRNPWFEKQLLPALRRAVTSALR
ncbi:MAG: uracil-DNA glycosylase family protein [Betaproteobacteria bacterium]|nr:uracil-DNA glycosylase family protein [Betaproteobacteria bacterium]